MRSLRMIRAAFIAVAVALLAGAPDLASAAAVRFIDDVDPNPVMVESSGFDCGSTYTVGVESVHFVGCWIAAGPAAAGVGHAIMVEPALDNNHGAVSDSIYIQYQVAPQPNGTSMGTVTIDFVSMPTGATIHYPAAGFPVIVEDGTMQLLNGFFVNPSAGPPYLPVQPPFDLQIFAQSDAGGATPAETKSWGSVKSIYR